MKKDDIIMICMLSGIIPMAACTAVIGLISMILEVIW